MNDFYVYICKDELDVVRYVGKGKANRMDDHIRVAKRHSTNRRTRFHAWLAKALKEERTVTMEKVAEGLAEGDAWQLELELIERIGRLEAGGTLLNLLAGGDGFSSDFAKANANRPEFKRLVSGRMRLTMADPVQKALMVEKMTAAKQTPAAREAASARRKNWISENRELFEAIARKNGVARATKEEFRSKLIEASRTEAAREKKSASLKAAWADETKRAGWISAAKTRNSSPEARKKLSDALKAAWQRPERAEAASAAAKRLWADPEWAAARRAQIQERKNTRATKDKK